MKLWPILLIFITSSAFAVPNITTVVASNTANGTQITVTGTGFGTKPNGVKPIHVWIEGGVTRDPHSLYSRTESWSAIVGDIQFITTGVAHGGNTNNQIGVDFTRCNISNNFNFYLEAALPSGSTMFAMMDRYRTFSDVDPMNNKTWRGWSSGYAIPDFVQSYCNDPAGGPSGCGDQSNRCLTENGGTIWADSYQGDYPAVNTWEVNSYEWRKGKDESTDADGRADGYWRNVRNGVLNQYGSDLPNGTGTVELWWFLEEFTGSGTCPGAPDNYEYWKNLYIDDSLSQVLVSSRNSNGTCTAITTGTFIRPAIPFGWSASSVSAYNMVWNVDVTNGMCVTLRTVDGEYSNTVAASASGSDPAVQIQNMQWKGQSQIRGQGKWK